MEPSPLYGELIVALSLRSDVLPQLTRCQAGPRRVVTAARDSVATLAAFAAGHQLVRGQMGDCVRERAQEAVEEMANSGREGRQLHTLKDVMSDDNMLIEIKVDFMFIC